MHPSADVDAGDDAPPRLWTITLPAAAPAGAKGCPGPSVGPGPSAFVTAPAPTPRAVTETPRWSKFVARHQANTVNPAMNHVIQETNPVNPELFDDAFVQSQISAKIRGYRYQDEKKNRLDAAALVGLAEVVALIRAAEFRCHYCHRPVKVVYEHVRDPEQWTLDRIDNRRGHDRDNVLLCCLACNLRRRCTHTDRFALSKKIQRVVLVGTERTAE